MLGRAASRRAAGLDATGADATHQKGQDNWRMPLRTKDSLHDRNSYSNAGLQHSLVLSPFHTVRVDHTIKPDRYWSPSRDRQIDREGFQPV
jgi:hypothetical protein